MKSIMTVFLCLFITNIFAQDINIEIDYFPEQKDEVTDENYNKGKKTLELVYNNLKNEYYVSNYISFC